jgi:hypothetical protein
MMLWGRQRANRFRPKQRLARLSKMKVGACTTPTANQVQTWRIMVMATIIAIAVDNSFICRGLRVATRTNVVRVVRRFAGTRKAQMPRQWRRESSAIWVKSIIFEGV